MNGEIVDPAKKIKGEMLAAVLQDNLNNKNNQPAMNKLDNLDLFINSLQNKDLRGQLLHENILEVVRKWLEPLPDKSLPNIKIIKRFLEVLKNISINKSLLLESKIGFIVHFYMNNPEGSKEIKNMAKEVIYTWLNKVTKDDEDD